MAEQEHTYPSDYQPGSHWALTEAWAILDLLRPGLLAQDTRAFLAAHIAATLIRVRRGGIVPRPPGEDVPND